MLWAARASGCDTIVTAETEEVTIELTPAAKTWLAEKGFDRAFGARPMARLVEKTIKRPLSELLLFGDIPDGGTVTVDLAGDGLSVLKA